jgi:hypothetical protein
MQSAPDGDDRSEREGGGILARRLVVAGGETTQAFDMAPGSLALR